MGVGTGLGGGGARAQSERGGCGDTGEDCAGQALGDTDLQGGFLSGDASARGRWSGGVRQATVVARDSEIVATAADSITRTVSAGWET